MYILYYNIGAARPAGAAGAPGAPGCRQPAGLLYYINYPLLYHIIILSSILLCYIILYSILF